MCKTTKPGLYDWNSLLAAHWSEITKNCPFRAFGDLIQSTLSQTDGAEPFPVIGSALGFAKSETYKTRRSQVSREKRLGRGLEALLGKVAVAETGSDPLRTDSGDVSSPQSYSTISSENDPESILQERLKSRAPDKIDIMSIDRNPYQPRQEFDTEELDALSASISTHGLLQPIVVRSNGERYQIIAGERRFRAAIRAGWSEVPVHVLSVDDRQMAELALTENLQRKDLNAIEKATAFSRYLELYGGTHEELAGRLEIDRSTVTNLIRLLDLPESVRTMILKEELTQGHARALIPLQEHEQKDIAKKIVEEKWSVRQTERFVKELLESDERGLSNPSSWGIVDQDGNRQPIDRNDTLVELEQEFRHRLGTKVKLTQSEKGKGKLVIPFTSHEEFERIYKWICRGSKVREVG